ncbi:MAG: DUF4249 domain-containing protein [Bacteroidota bacterium]
MRVVIFLFTIAFLCHSCLEKIDFDTDFPDNLLVVDGTFTDTDEVDQVRLSFAIDYGNQTLAPIQNAQLTLYDDKGNSEELVEVGDGDYQFVKARLSGRVGTSYHLEILLNDGRLYRSEPEILRAAPPIDSFLYTVRPFERTNDFGRIINEVDFQLSVQTDINSEQQTSFLRWDVEHVYAFQQPYLYYIPFSSSAVCYVTEELNAQAISIFDGRNFAENATIREQVASKEMDYTFAYAQSYRVSQYAMSERAYTYCSQIDQISNRVGNIFDVPPAPVRGNIKSVNDPEETVLGFFNVSGVSRSTLFLTPGDTQEFYQPIQFCAGTFNNSRDQLPQPCYGCLVIQGSSLERPFYW